jgi:hypothetical protein
MLRNLNRTYSRGRVCGTPQSGVAGSLIPSTGSHGPGYAYSSLSLPADNDKEYQGYITSIPTGLTIFANEDTSFTASANDGTYTVPWDLYENGVFLGSTSFSLTFGSGAVISCTVGNAAAAGSLASISGNVVLQALVGNALAAGSTATISSIAGSSTIAALVGDAAANGKIAAITSIPVNITIATSVGSAVAAGVSPTITVTLNAANYAIHPSRLVLVTSPSRYVAVTK